ncbi:unnamed protein product [Rhizophagus irregularis]|uniref:Uncharacterized protein n=1 Tax=Rhizophagus irregularis TaxID=588596 RepID=A0A915ZXP3_9GLOM|nr:unnamed protein product [Rhizophagus irregularis]
MTTKKKSIIASYYGTGYKRIKNEFLDSDFPKRGKLLIFNHEMLFVKLDQLKNIHNILVKRKKEVTVSYNDYELTILFEQKHHQNHSRDFIGIIRGNVTITDNEIYDLYDFDWHYFYEGDLCV